MSQNRISNDETNHNRWTCEACGCVTNSIEADPTSCSVCGSPRQIPDVLRREEALSSQLLRRSFFVRRGGTGLDLHRSFNHNLDEMENDMMDGDEEEHAVAALALEVAGVTDAARIPGTRSRNDLFLRSVSENMPLALDAIRSSSNSIPAPNELLDFATENSTLYDPQWIKQKANKMDVGEKTFANVATLPIGATEGKSIRSLQHLPLPCDLPDGNSVRRKIFGFRVAFKRPYREMGKSLGGNYLIGITTSSFSNFGERNSLQQSSLFWGIGDNGHKYEGGPSIASIRGPRRPQHSIEINHRNNARSGDSLYGCMETITVVVDMESRTLTFWRNDVVLGTLVRNIPASGELYPVAVPFNPGASVAITGLNGNPTQQLQHYEIHVNELMMAKKKKRRKEISKQRSFLVCGSCPTKDLETALKSIFMLYKKDDGSSGGIDVISASRLWYRSCLKLSHLDEIVSKKVEEEKCLYSQVSVSFQDFFSTICEILREDEAFHKNLTEHVENFDEDKNSSRNWKEFMVGSIVELVEGYEVFGDAARGPMIPGDRGQVVEVQQGSNGERYSVRVLFNGRRWWYQPQTLLSEKSGLVATPGIWFIQRILRSHGYNHISLRPIWAETVTGTSWVVGDIVVPASSVDSSSADKKSFGIVEDSLVGRLVPTSTLSATQGYIHDRDSGMVCVEFVDPLFSLRVGLVEEANDERSPSRVHSVSVKKLAHAGISQVRNNSEDLPDFTEDVNSERSTLTSTILAKDIMSISMLDTAAIENVSKICKKNYGTLARLFTLGLPSAVASALELAKTRARNNEDVSNYLPALSALGNLIIVIAKHFFREKGGDDTFSNETEKTVDTSEKTNMASLYVALPNQDDLSFTNDPDSSQEISGSYQFDQSQHWEENPPKAVSLRTQSSVLHSIRRGGFETFSHGEDARRGSLVLNAATKSAISNGVLANNYAWFSKVAEAAKRRKSPTAASSLINARDEDGTQLLMLAISLGCSESIISYLVRNGAIINDDVIRKAAYLDQKNVLAYLLTEYVYVEGAVDCTACSEEIIETIDEARKRQKEQEDNLHKNAQEFFPSIVISFIEFGVETRCCFAPKTAIYRVIAQILVGRTLLRAMHNNRLRANLPADLSSTPMNPKAGRIDPESGRVAVFLDDEKGCDSDQVNPSSVAAFEGLLFTIPPSTFLDTLLTTGKEMNRFLPAYLCFMEALIWTKDVEDIALGCALLAVFMKRVPAESQITTLERVGISDMLSVHAREAGKQIELLARNRASLMSDSRRFSPHHIAPRKEEVKDLLSTGIVLCPQCHVADLHLTRHSSFRCDLCGKGIERGYPMHGCRECDWDACEDCINRGEGGVVKWAYVKELVDECILLHNSIQSCVRQQSPTNQILDRSQFPQNLPSRIKALDCGALEQFSKQLECPGAVTMFEFTSYYLPVIHDTLYDASSNMLSHSRSTKYCEPPNKKRRSQYVSVSKTIDQSVFFAKVVNLLLLKPIETSIAAAENNIAMKENQHSEAQEEPEPATFPGDDTKSNNKQNNEDLTRHTPELLRRLHEVLSFCERFDCTPPNHGSNDLRSLTEPWEIEVAPVKSKFQEGLKSFHLYVEPLTHTADLTRHLAQFAACKVPSYFTFCQSLADDHSIIAECIGSSDKSDSVFRLARVISYDAETGVHTLRYASRIKFPLKHNGRLFLNPELVNTIQFEGPEAVLVLSCRQYFVIKRFKNARRDEYKSIVQNVLKTQDIGEKTSARYYPDEALTRGIRIGYSSPGSGDVKPYTIIGCSNLKLDSNEDTNFMYDIVSDEGSVLKGISQQEIKVEEAEDRDVFSRSRMMREGMGLHSRDPSSQLMGLRGIGSGESESEKVLKPKVGSLRRTWSALSPCNDLAPVDLAPEDKESYHNDAFSSMLKCSIPDQDVESFLPLEFVEEPPQISVQLSLEESSIPLEISPETETIYAFIQRLIRRKSSMEITTDLENSNLTKIFYTIASGQKLKASSKTPGFPDSHFMHNRDEQCTSMLLTDPSTPLLPEILASPNREPIMSGTWSSDCEKVAIRSIQLIDCLGRHITESGTHLETQSQINIGLIHDIVDAALESRSLTRKLSEQLDQTLPVVSGALPIWCTEVPVFAPRLFNCNARRQLLERTAFGVSRATMRLQEAKVNVAPLRQRMAALRGRAVELVGEAFSGGAEDPTALQLQADELYGMEEALGARVNAAFRAQRWQERSLQCAKAAVRRSHLLADAWTVMDRYTKNKMYRQRRLEVRFDGESGFDAASGDEAGVTRGFYADVAEAFLSCENILSTGSGLICHPGSESPLLAENSAVKGTSTIHEKLPLWIPDLDASFKVVIPTPRANPQSSPGIYPRPLSPDHEQMPSIKRQFRLIGRIFAGAIRDGFMFPLPLSSAFLQLVQNCDGITVTRSRSAPLQPVQKLSGISRSAMQEQLDASDEYSCEENTPTTGNAKGLTEFYSPVQLKAATNQLKNCLDSYNLPRPGFLGGEVFAVEEHICNSLNQIDSMNLRKDEAEKRYLQIASERSFARKAFGKTYDCSFEEYFENKTFVDPLDPTQGAFSTPLCPNGHLREVTIFNVRDYVLLCKQFILCDGVLEQAKAFREGICDFFPARFIRLFTGQELQRDVFGSDVDKWTEEDIRKLFKLDGAKGATEALVAVAAIGGEGGASLSRRFGSSSPTIGFLIKTLLESTTTQRRQFLNFVTSVPIVTPGKIEVVPIVSPSGDFLPVQDNCLPRANTCARRLYLPKFENYERFSSVLWAVIREESRFKGFFEWRGN